MTAFTKMVYIQKTMKRTKLLKIKYIYKVNYENLS